MVKYLIKFVVIINRWWDILMLSGFRRIFWIFDVTILVGLGERGVGCCLGFICNLFQKLRFWGKGDYLFLPPPPLLWGKIKKTHERNKHFTVYSGFILYGILWSQMFCLLYFLFAFLAVSETSHLHVHSGAHQTVWSTIKTPTSSPHTSCLVHSNIIFALFIMSEWVIVV